MSIVFLDNTRINKKERRINDVLTNHNYIVAAERARKWIERNTVRGNGIVITSKQRTIYQEVTGYYIPTLLQWGMRDRAIKYAKYLCEAQRNSGAWGSYDLKNDSVFNTGQVLRGLLEISDIMPEVSTNIMLAANFLMSHIESDGRLKSAEGTIWPTDGTNSELIHLYCLPPLYEAGKKYGNQKYVEYAELSKKYYIEKYRNDIDNFNYLSHFYAYVLEALVDLGEVEIVEPAMKKIERIQRKDGSVPAYSNVKWVCSTGLFQLAIIWFKLGDFKHGNMAFDYAVSLQNASGGWYGGYEWPDNDHFISTLIHSYENVTYFANEEISWAVKYFFDALYYREVLEFRNKAHTFIKYIDSEDGKFEVIDGLIGNLDQIGEKCRILDVGCGKGRYLKKLLLRHPEDELYGVDLSEEVLKYVKNDRINLKTGSILRIPYEDEEFDAVFAAEALEHAVLLEEAVCEMIRVLKKGGTFIVIDKDNRSLEKYKFKDWFDPDELSTKQWIDKEKMRNLMQNSGLGDIDIYTIDTDDKNLYCAFVGRKK